MRVLYVTLVVLLLDQFSKLAVKGVNIPFLGLHHEGMQPGMPGSIPLLGDWLKFTFTENPGMAFSISFGGQPFEKLFLTIFAIAATVGLIVYLYRHHSAPRLVRLAIALIIAGALGNVIDRVFYGVLYGYAPLVQGHVVDFISVILPFGTGGYYWPIFNVADSAVSIGVVLMLIATWTHPEPKPESGVAEASAAASSEPSPGP
jgi:signal peptidase II